MKFNELPTNQKLLFVAHSMVAIAGLLSAYASILTLCERGMLPVEIAKNTPQPMENKSRSGFFD